MTLPVRDNAERAVAVPDFRDRNRSAVPWRGAPANVRSLDASVEHARLVPEHRYVGRVSV